MRADRKVGRKGEKPNRRDDIRPIIVVEFLSGWSPVWR